MSKQACAVLFLALLVWGCGDDDGGAAADTASADGTDVAGDSVLDGSEDLTEQDTTVSGDTATPQDTTTQDTTSVPSYCAAIQPSAKAGEACGTSGDCDANSQCMQIPPAATKSCLQICSPDRCPDCGTGLVCLTLTNSATGQPRTAPDGSIEGVCAPSPTGNAGAYDKCDGTTLCQAGLTCVGMPGGATSLCSPSCAGASDTTCPEREGATASCEWRVGSTEPTNCAIACDPATPACPAGMTCQTFSGPSYCMWP